MLPVTALMELLVPSLGIMAVALWTVACVWLGFRMGRQVVIPGEQKPEKLPKRKEQVVDIDKTHDDLWEQSLSDQTPGERITGDLQ